MSTVTTTLRPYTPPTAPDTWVRAAGSLLTCAGLPPVARLGYLILQRRAWAGDGCTVDATVPEIAADLGVCEHTARQALRALVATGLLTWQRRGQGQPSRFTLTPIPLRGAKDAGPAAHSMPGKSETSRRPRPAKTAAPSIDQDLGVDQINRSVESDPHPLTPSHMLPGESGLLPADGGGGGGNFDEPRIMGDEISASDEPRMPGNALAAATDGGGGGDGDPVNTGGDTLPATDAEQIATRLEADEVTARRLARLAAQARARHGYPAYYVAEQIDYVLGCARIENPLACFAALVGRGERRRPGAAPRGTSPGAYWFTQQRAAHITAYEQPEEADDGAGEEGDPPTVPVLVAAEAVAAAPQTSPPPATSNLQPPTPALVPASPPAPVAAPAPSPPLAPDPPGTAIAHLVVGWVRGWGQEPTRALLDDVGDLWLASGLEEEAFCTLLRREAVGLWRHKSTGASRVAAWLDQVRGRIAEEAPLAATGTG